MTQLDVQQARARLRDDGGAQRIRERREQSAERAVEADGRPSRSTGTTTASPRSARAPTSRTSPSSGCSAFYRTYYQPDNAVADDRRQVRRRRDARADRAGFRRDSEADARAAEALHRGAGAGRRARGHACAASAARSASARCITRAAGAHPDATAIEALGEIMTVEPGGPPVQGAGRRQEGVVRRELVLPAARRGLRRFSARRCRRRSDRCRRATRCSPRCTTSPRSRSPTPSSTACARRRRRTSTTRSTIRRRSAVALAECDRGRRLAALLHSPRPLAHGDRRRRQSRRATQYLKPSNLTVGKFLPDAKPDRAPVPRRSTSRRWSTTTRAIPPSPPARRSIRRRRTSRRARSGSHFPTA